MTMFDIAVIAVVAISGVLAYARGSVHEVLSIAGWVAAVLATMYGTALLKPFMLQVIADDFFATVVSGILLFIVTLVFMSLLTRSISRRVKDSALGALDRSLGAVFGFMRGAIIVCFAYIAYEWVIPVEEQGPWIREARAVQWVEVGSAGLMALVPEDPEAEGEKTPAEGEISTRDKVQQMFKDAITPTVETPAGEKANGYETKDRKDLDRLLNTNQ